MPLSGVPGVAESELDPQVRATMRMMLYSASGSVQEGEAWNFDLPKTAKFLDGMIDPKALPEWLTQADLDYYVGEFERTGFRGERPRHCELMPSGCSRPWGRRAGLGPIVRLWVRICRVGLGLALALGSALGLEIPASGRCLVRPHQVDTSSCNGAR